ncbi:hypothetical protein PanWU01x14_247020 [Parasponia andersonii]|uniref:Uncharacterized protein n=1 Tax=Parasponia andersonii TaxID=3476 RepID=A0A2P5BE67_PARAD|nr:hypothetical protein PanWU01x14_247020 [Parasponia andersonii]
MKNPWGVVVFMGKRLQEAFYVFLFGPSLLQFPQDLRNWWRQVMVSSLGGTGKVSWKEEELVPPANPNLGSVWRKMEHEEP